MNALNDWSDIDRAFKDNFFTHAYIECGFLDGNEASFSKAWAKDDRSIFDLASLTKALCTSVLMFAASESGSVDLDQSVTSYLTDLTHQYRNVIFKDDRHTR